MLNYRLLSSTTEVAELLPYLMSRPTWGFDTETTGLDPRSDKVAAVQIGNFQEQFIIDTRVASVEPLRPFFEAKTHKKVGHNLAFDYKMMRGSFDICPETSRDTFLAEQILNAGRMGISNSLKATLQRRFGIELDKQARERFGKGPVLGEYTTEDLEYMARDVEHLIPLAQSQCEEMGRLGLGPTWLLECDVMPCFADMEFEGQYLDVPGWQKIMEHNLAEAALAKAEMDEIVCQIMPIDLFGKAYVNYGSPDQVVEVLRAMRVKVPEYNRASRQTHMVLVTSSDDKTLKKVKDNRFIKLLKKYRGHMIRASTFGQPYIDALHPNTGMLHPRFKQIGTATGRPAKDGDVNMLNIPREKAFRNCFRGAPDEVVETDDFSGCELRIWAEISNDPQLMDAFSRGLDVHCYVGTKLYGVEVTKNNENAHLRTPAKSLNFGIAYGMGPGRLHDELNGAGFPITREDAKKLFQRYETEFKTGVDFLRDAGHTASTQGYLYNLNGRRRYWHLPDPNDLSKFPNGARDERYNGILSSIAREGGNFMIQSVNADITKLAMVKIRDYVRAHRIRARFMNQVYDEIVTRTHKDDSEAFHPIKMQLMREAAEHWIKRVPMEVDGHVGPCWTK